MPTYVTVKTEVLATHSWPDAPEHRKYLRNIHAHKFLIEVNAGVDHADRQIEFHDLYDRLNKVIASLLDYRLNSLSTFGHWSCEQIGLQILKNMPSVSFVLVSEDGQFEAKVIRDGGSPDKHKCQAYLASSSKGYRGLLLQVANKLAKKGYMVFAPCLAFVGTETPEIRQALLNIGTNTLIQWSSVLFILDEGIPSPGCDAESDLAQSNNIPTFRIDKDSVNQVPKI